MTDLARPTSVERRRFLRHTWTGVSASLALALIPGRDLFATQRFGTKPFTLGVASGDPTPHGIVLWTRLVPEPADPASLGHRSTCQDWASGYYTAYRDMLANDLDLVLHLGDYTTNTASATRHEGRSPMDSGSRPSTSARIG